MFTAPKKDSRFGLNKSWNYFDFDNFLANHRPLMDFSFKFPQQGNFSPASKFIPLVFFFKHTNKRERNYISWLLVVRYGQTCKHLLHWGTQHLITVLGRTFAPKLFWNFCCSSNRICTFAKMLVFAVYPVKEKLRPVANNIYISQLLGPSCTCKAGKKPMNNN